MHKLQIVNLTSSFYIIASSSYNLRFLIHNLSYFENCTPYLNFLPEFDRLPPILNFLLLL